MVRIPVGRCLRAKVVRRRAEGDATPVEVTPEIVVEMLGAPKPDPDSAGRPRRPGTVLGLCFTARGGQDVSFVQASRLPDTGALTPTGLQDESMQESARTAMSWLPANAGPVRSGPVLPAGHRRASSRAGGELGAAGRNLGGGRHGGRPGNGVDRPAVCGDLGMTGEITSPAELAAHLGRGLSASAVDGNGSTVLHYAAALDWPAMARALLAVGVPLAARLRTDGEPFGPGLPSTLELLRPGPVRPVPPTRRDPALHCGSRQRVRSCGGSARARRGPGRCRCDIGDPAAPRGRLATGCGRGTDRATIKRPSGWERDSLERRA